MLKTIIVLPNGTEISSGYESVNAIHSVTVTHSVNNSKELTLGSAVAGKLNANFISPEGNLQVNAGDEVTVYKTDDEGVRHLVGMFTLEKPTRPSANRTAITAYDRVTWLDKDLTAWLSALDGWPYSLLTFADMVCEACGLALVNDSIPNGDYQVPAFAAQGITGRKLMQWIGEIAGRFCRATPDGKIEFAWYEPSGVSITPDGDRFYYQSGLSYEEYQVAPIEKVQLRLTENDVGVVWPEETGEKNTYIISGNYLLTTTDSSTLLPLAQTLYEQLQDVTFTPCKVVVPAGMDIHAGHTVQITDRNGKTFTSYVMTKTQAGQRDTLECTGSPRRDSTSVVNNESYRALAHKMLEIKKDVEGLAVKASEIETMGGDIDSVREYVAQVALDVGGIKTSVRDLEGTIEGVSDDLQNTKGNITSLEQTASQFKLDIQKINEDGVSKVSNTTGIFDEAGMTVDNSESPTKTTVTPDGMKVYRKSGSTSEPVLSATSSGVDATNLHAKTYLIIGDRSRFENYGSNRTGCFWIGDAT